MPEFNFKNNAVFNLSHIGTRRDTVASFTYTPSPFTGEYKLTTFDKDVFTLGKSLDRPFALENLAPSHTFTLSQYLISEVEYKQPLTFITSDKFNLSPVNGSLFEPSPQPAITIPNAFNLTGYVCDSALNGGFTFRVADQLNVFRATPFTADFDFNRCNNDLTIKVPSIGSGSARLGFSATGSGDYITQHLANAAINTGFTVIGGGDVTNQSVLTGSGSGVAVFAVSATGIIEEPPLATADITLGITVSGTGEFSITTQSDGDAVLSVGFTASGLALISDNLGSGNASTIGLIGSGTGTITEPIIPEYNRSYFLTDRVEVVAMGGYEQSNSDAPEIIEIPETIDQLSNPRRAWGLSTNQHLTTSDTIARSISYCSNPPKINNVNGIIEHNQNDGGVVSAKTCMSSSGTGYRRLLNCQTGRNSITTNQAWFTQQNSSTIKVTTKCLLSVDTANKNNTFCDNVKASVTANRTICILNNHTIIPPQGLSPWLEYIPPEEEPEEPEEPLEPIGVYTMTNDIGLELLDGTVLATEMMRLSLDVNSHSWTLGATLTDATQRALIKPSDDGTLVVVVAKVNGYQWLLLVEKVTTNKTFNNNGISIECRGLSSELSNPYMKNTSLEVTEDLTNQQIAELIIPTELGEWEIEWNIETWLIPANTYEHKDTSPISALLRLVNNCGGVLVPDREERIFYVIPRYTVTPWEFETTAPQFTVDESTIFSLTEEPTAQTTVNGVFLNGMTNGVQGLVRLTASAGDQLATSTSNSMLVDDTALRSLGTRIIAAAQPQPTISSFSTWCDGSKVPLFGIGDFIRINVDGENTHGVINRVSLNCTLSQSGVVDVIQTIGIGESTGNQFALFSALSTPEPLAIVTIIDSFGGRARVAHVDGTEQVVRGDGITGGNYYLKGGQLLSSAPDLPVIPDVII